MFNTRNTAFVFATSVALAASLGLAACGSNNAATTQTEQAEEQQVSAEVTTDASTTAAADAAATESTVAKYQLTSVLIGMGQDDMTYFFENDAQDAGAFLVYYASSNTYKRWAGPMTVSADGQYTITDGDTGKTITFTLTPEDDEIYLFVATNGIKATMSADSVDSVGGTLDEISAYATPAEE